MTTARETANDSIRVCDAMKQVLATIDDVNSVEEVRIEFNVKDCERKMIEFGSAKQVRAIIRPTKVLVKSVDDESDEDSEWHVDLKPIRIQLNTQKTIQSEYEKNMIVIKNSVKCDKAGDYYPWSIEGVGEKGTVSQYDREKFIPAKNRTKYNKHRSINQFVEYVITKYSEVKGFTRMLIKFAVDDVKSRHYKCGTIYHVVCSKVAYYDAEKKGHVLELQADEYGIKLPEQKQSMLKTHRIDYDAINNVIVIDGKKESFMKHGMKIEYYPFIIRAHKPPKGQENTSKE